MKAQGLLGAGDGVRGNLPAPGTQWTSTQAFAVGVQSAKPDWRYELIEAYFPTLPEIELNARCAQTAGIVGDSMLPFPLRKPAE